MLDKNEEKLLEDLLDKVLRALNDGLAAMDKEIMEIKQRRECGEDIGIEVWSLGLHMKKINVDFRVLKKELRAEIKKFLYEWEKIEERKRCEQRIKWLKQEIEMLECQGGIDDSGSNFRGFTV